MGVITPQGVVGVVIKVGHHDAQVLLMTDRRSAVAAVVERTRDAGIVQGMASGRGEGMEGVGRLHVKYMPRSAAVRPGDRLVTSGLEGSFVEGIPIGQIETINPVDNQPVDNQPDGLDDTEMFLNVQVIPTVAFSKLEEVLIITSTPAPAGSDAAALPQSSVDTKMPQ